jgi:hypothetical protein
VRLTLQDDTSRTYASNTVLPTETKYRVHEA